MNVAEMFDAALRRAGIPIHGVSIGTLNDRATWKVHYTDAASPAQIVSGDALRLSYDPGADTAYADEDAERHYAAQKLAQALAVGLWECIPSPTMTKPQLKARVLQIYKTLT